MTMTEAIFVQVESQSTPGKFYTVRQLPSGEVRCDCPKFVFSRQAVCKHTQAFRLKAQKKSTGRAN